MTDAIAREGIRRGARSLLAAYRDGGNEAAREDMALTSLFGGLALANAGLGAVHGFAGPIGGMFHAAHGAICASLLPYVMKYNAQVIQGMPEMAQTSARFTEIAQWVTGDSDADMMDGVAWIKPSRMILISPDCMRSALRSRTFLSSLKSRKSHPACRRILFAWMRRPLKPS